MAPVRHWHKRQPPSSVCRAGVGRVVFWKGVFPNSSYNGAPNLSVLLPRAWSVFPARTAYAIFRLRSAGMGAANVDKHALTQSPAPPPCRFFGLCFTECNAQQPQHCGTSVCIRAWRALLGIMSTSNGQEVAYLPRGRWSDVS